MLIWTLRTTLVLSLLLIFSTLSGCAMSGEVVAQPVTRVVVIGAGYAGLTAARILHNAGIETVVLEARDRVGGRTFTDEVDGASVDLGAAWIHGDRKNPIAAMARAQNIDYRPHDYDIAHGVDTEAGIIRERQIAAAYKQAEAFESAAPGILFRLGFGASAGDALDHWMAKQSFGEERARLVRYLITQAIELDYGAPIDTIALRWIGSESGKAGGDHVLDGGYKRLLTTLAEGLDIRLSDPVTQIAHTDEGVTVSTKEGKIYEASHVVVTVPLGVLKAGSIAFDPPLPEEKRRSIDRLDMANLEKVVLRFDEVFWPEITGEMGMVLDADDPGRFPAFFDFTEFAGAPTLVCLYGGTFARKAQDTMTDEALVAGTIQSLRHLVEADVPQPRATKVTRWRGDPFSFGSYSYIPTGASPDDMEELGRPIDGRILFAGEATHLDYPSTVHGAILSGIREAERLGASKSAIPGL